MMKFMIFCFFWFGINRIDELNVISFDPCRNFWNWYLNNISYGLLFLFLAVDMLITCQREEFFSCFPFFS